MAKQRMGQQLVDVTTLPPPKIKHLTPEQQEVLKGIKRHNLAADVYASMEDSYQGPKEQYCGTRSMD